MILLPKTIIIFLFVLFCFAVLGLGIYGFRLINGVSEMPSAEIKSEGERFLFAAIACVSVIAAITLFFAGRTRHITRELDKLIEISRYNDVSPELSMKKLGKIGEQVTLLHFSLNALNERKSLKISALSHLVEFLLKNTSIPLLVTNLRGAVAYASGSFLDKQGQNRAGVIDAEIRTIYPRIPFDDIVLKLSRSNSLESVKIDRQKISYLPVKNRSGELTYIVWVFDSSEILPLSLVPKKKKRRVGIRGTSNRGRNVIE